VTHQVYLIPVFETLSLPLAVALPLCRTVAEPAPLSLGRVTPEFASPPWLASASPVSAAESVEDEGAFGAGTVVGAIKPQTNVAIAVAPCTDAATSWPVSGVESTHHKGVARAAAPPVIHSTTFKRRDMSSSPHSFKPQAVTRQDPRQLSRIRAGHSTEPASPASATAKSSAPTLISEQMRLLARICHEEPSWLAWALNGK
jgi:hypothetical protein